MFLIFKFLGFFVGRLYPAIGSLAVRVIFWQLHTVVHMFDLPKVVFSVGAGPFFGRHDWRAFGQLCRCLENPYDGKFHLQFNQVLHI